MTSSVLEEIFAPEIEQAVQDYSKEMILELFRVGVTIPQIAQAAKLSKNEVMNIVNDNQ
jgi:hypothetical protein